MRVILCDDHLLLIEAFATALTSAGHEVVALATEPEDARRAVLELEPDVLVLDETFPHASGLELARSLLAERPDVKIIMLSARNDPRLVNAAMAAGAAGFLLKEQSIGGILRALDRVAAGEAAVDPELLRAAMRVPGSASRSRSDRLRYLTPREREALLRVVEGESTKEIARAMGVSHSTARTHVQNVLIKLGVRSRLQAAALVAREGLGDDLSPPEEGW